MQFDRVTTTLAFVAIVAVSAIGVSFTPMAVQTLTMMVIPSMILFGAVMLVLGIKHGEHRARS